MFGSLVNRAIAHNLAHKWQLLGGVLQRRQLGRGRQMRTRQVETFSLRKLQQPSPGLATLLPPTQPPRTAKVVNGRREISQCPAV